MNTENPWKTIGRKKVYTNPWIEVEHHDVLNPSGNKGIYGQVNFKNIAIGIIPVDEEGYTYLIGQYRYPINQYSWEIPEGGGPLDEAPIDSAKRELKEETGIIASTWTEIQKIHTSNSVCNETGIIYLAEELNYFESSPEETEQLIIKKIKLKKVFQMVLRGEITDSLSLAGIFKLKHLKPDLFV